MCKQNYFEKFETLWIPLVLITGSEEIYIYHHRKARGSTKGIRNVSSSSPFGIRIKIYLTFSADLPLLTASHSETKQMLKVEDENINNFSLSKCALLSWMFYLLSLKSIAILHYSLIWRIFPSPSDMAASLFSLHSAGWLLVSQKIASPVTCLLRVQLPQLLRLSGVCVSGIHSLPEIKFKLPCWGW